MANFLAVLAPDPERRSRYLECAAPGMACFPEMKVGRKDAVGFSVAWAAAPSAPVSVHEAPEGVAVLLGDAFPPEGREPLQAKNLFQLWSEERPEDSPAADGFHVGVVFKTPGRLVVGCDILGLFPVYWFEDGRGAIVTSSSPEFLRHVLSFHSKLDLRGLADVLLTGGPVRGRTLWSGVRRLSPGHLLIAGPGSSMRVGRQYLLPLGGGGSSRSLDEAAEEVHEQLRRTVGRWGRRNGHHTLFLSGGRDSRLIAGYLDATGADFGSVTLGRRSDFEAVCSRSAARALRIPNEVWELPWDRYPELARVHTRLEHLMGHFSGMYTWGSGSALPHGTGRAWSGHLLELVCGGVHLEWGSEAGSEEVSWDGFWQTVQDHAIAADDLFSFVCDPALREAIRETAEEVREIYTSHSDLPGEQARAFSFSHWARHHPGSVPWRVSFTRWPALPVLDQGLLSAAADIPTEHLGRRRLQDTILVRYHPRLAKALLLRSSGTLDPILPGFRSFRGSRFYLPPRLRWGWMDPRRSSRESRAYYRRIYDLENEGWLAVRKEAEPMRGHLHSFFRAEWLGKYLPPPNRPLVLERPIAEGFGRKTLLGLMLWMRAH